MADIDLDPLNYGSQHELDRAVLQATDEADNLDKLMKDINAKINKQRSQRGGPDKSLLDEAIKTRQRIQGFRRFVAEAPKVSKNLPPMPADFLTAAERGEKTAKDYAKLKVAEGMHTIEGLMDDLSPGKLRALELSGNQDAGLMAQARGLAPIAPGVLGKIAMTINPLTLGMSPERLGAIFGAGEMAGDPRKITINNTSGVDTGVSMKSAAQNPLAHLDYEVKHRLAQGMEPKLAGELAGEAGLSTSRQAADYIKKSTKFNPGAGLAVKAANTALYGGLMGYGGLKTFTDVLDSSRPIDPSQPLDREQREFLMRELEPLREQANLPQLAKRTTERQGLEKNAIKALHAKLGFNPATTPIEAGDIEKAFPIDKQLEDKLDIAQREGLSLSDLVAPKNKKRLQELLRGFDQKQPVYLGGDRNTARFAVWEKSLEGGNGAWVAAEAPIGSKGFSMAFEPDDYDKKFDAEIKTLADYQKLAGGEEAIKSWKAKKEKKGGKVTIE